MGIRSGRSLTIAWKSKNGVVSEIGSESEAEFEGPEGFHFLPTPPPLQSLMILCKLLNGIENTNGRISQSQSSFPVPNKHSSHEETWRPP